MKVTKYLVEQNTHEDQTGLMISLRKLELGSIGKLHTMIDTKSVTVIELDGNFLKQLDIQVLKQFQSLIVLTAPLNFIEKISNLTILKQLQELDLSTNRIKLIADLSGMEALEYLVTLQLTKDVSRNQIAYIERLPENLKVLKAGFNQLDDMGYVPGKMQVLDLKGNKIYRITDIAKVAGHLHILDLQDNIISKDQFSDLLVFLEKYALSLKELVLAGNEISSTNNYLIQILGKRQLEKLDHMIITPYILKAFTQIKNQKDISQVIQQTRAQYARRIKDEVEAKQKILQNLKAKQQAVEELFRQFRDSNAERLMNFEQYCNKAFLKDGKDLEYEHQIVKDFDKRLKNAEEVNSFEARQRRRKEFEDQSQLSSKLQPRKDLYGKPGYQLPLIQQVKDSRQGSSIRSGSRQQPVSEEYIRKKPYIPSRQNIPDKTPDSFSNIPVYQLPASNNLIPPEPYPARVSNPPYQTSPPGSNQLSNPSASKPTITNSNPTVSNQPSSRSQIPSQPQQQSSGRGQSKQSKLSQKSQPKLPSNTSILNTIKQKRESINSQRRKDSKLSQVSSPEDNNDKEGIFDKECYPCFEQYFNKSK